MTVLNMGNRNAISISVRSNRKIYSRAELKKKYSFACRNGFYCLAKIYLYALYGKKDSLYVYKRNMGELYAFEYPPIKA